MIKSIRYFLLISLLISITLASAINGIGNYLLDEQVIQPYLDGQLTRVTTLIDILNQSSGNSLENKAKIIKYLQKTHPQTSKHFFFQIWNDHDKLVMDLPDQHNTSLKDAPWV